MVNPGFEDEVLDALELVTEVIQDKEATWQETWDAVEALEISLKRLKTALDEAMNERREPPTHPGAENGEAPARSGDLA
jgi:hypothetical protein